MYIFYYTKGGLISEGILTLVSLPIKGAKSLPWAENLNKLFTEKGRKFEFSAQGQDLAPFVGNVTKIKIHSEIKSPLFKTYAFISFAYENIKNCRNFQYYQPAQNQPKSQILFHKID